MIMPIVYQRVRLYAGKNDPAYVLGFDVPTSSAYSLWVNYKGCCLSPIDYLMIINPVLLWNSIPN